jgi:FkbM family methyltransferase
MQLRRVTGLDWLSDRIAPYINLSGRKTLAFEDDNGVTIVSDGAVQLAVPSGTLQARKFRHGIAKRTHWLAASYGVGKHISIRPGDVVVNCGANIGILTLALADRGARVIAVEPDPTTLVALRRNVGHRPEVEIVPAGLWNEDGPLTFYQAPETSDTSAINQLGPPLTVDAYRLDTLVATRGIARLRLLVGDAEGAEPEVLEGASETLLRTEYFAMDCGYERRGERTLERCQQILGPLGFETVRVSRNRLVARNRAIAES